ncbi:MAG: zinc metallopeptidase [Clostridia bacterium]|nr:zinc metallopeptidase [Clostridia bacterium]
MYFDYYYLVLVLPMVILSLIAQAKVNSSFSKYSKVSTRRNFTATEAVRQILDNNGLHNVKIEAVSGKLTDHYDPKANVIRLSDSVRNSTSVAAVGVAAHEAGHAVQHAKGYAPIRWRNSLVGVANLGSKLSIPLILIGLVLVGMESMLGEIIVYAGIIMFSAAVLFQVVTLPVEFDASKRAIAVLGEDGYLYEDEVGAVKKVLSAAAMTYVAAAATSIAQLLRLILIARDRD